MWSRAILLSALVAAVSAQIPSLGWCPDYQPMANFNMNRFLGQWHEAERYFTVSELGSRCVTTTYDKMPDGRVWVSNEIKNAFTGVKRVLDGTLQLVGREGEGKLIVKYASLPVPYDTQYSILDTDYETFAVVWSCSGIGPVHTHRDAESKGFRDMDAILTGTTADSPEARLVAGKEYAISVTESVIFFPSCFKNTNVTSITNYIVSRVIQHTTDMENAWVMTRERLAPVAVMQRAYGVLDRYKISRAFFVKTNQEDCSIIPPPIDDEITTDENEQKKSVGKNIGDGSIPIEVVEKVQSIAENSQSGHSDVKAVPKSVPVQKKTGSVVEDVGGQAVLSKEAIQVPELILSKSEKEGKPESGIASALKDETKTEIKIQAISDLQPEPLLAPTLAT